MLKRRYQLLLLAAVVMAAFYPAVLAGFSRIDDASMAGSYNAIQGWDLENLFIPFAGNNTYYRPLLGLSFLVDKHFLGLLPGLMHLENILFHLINAIFVYYLTLYVLPPGERNRSYLPLLAGLLFGLHPINTESVNWISGRTDVLAGGFVLSSAICIMLFRETQEKKYAVLSFIAFLGGVLVKETALAFLPGAFILSTVPRHTDECASSREKQSGRFPLKSLILMLTGGMLIALFFYVPRFATIGSHSGRIGLTLMSVSNNGIHSMLIILRAFAFYVKKLVFPYPLNFAIVEVDPFYEVMSVPLVALCLYVMTQKTLLRALFMSGIFLIAPAFVLVFGQIAWTPYAERYVYISSAFILVTVVVYLSDKLKIEHALLTKGVITAVLAIMFVATLNRSIIWQDDLKLCKDTVEKSPASREIRLVYSTILMENGELTEALNQLDKARVIPYLEYNERLDLNTADIYYQQRRIDDALKYSATAFQRTHGTSKKALEYLICLTELKKRTYTTRSQRHITDRKIYEYYRQLYRLDPNPRLLYHLGVTAEALGEYSKANTLFEQARNNLSSNDPYRVFAQKKIDRLLNASRKDYAKLY